MRAIPVVLVPLLLVALLAGAKDSDADSLRAQKGTITGFGGLFTTIHKAHPNAKYDANWYDFAGNGEGYAEGDWATLPATPHTWR